VGAVTVETPSLRLGLRLGYGSGSNKDSSPLNHSKLPLCDVIPQPIIAHHYQWHNSHITRVDKVHRPPRSQGSPGFLANFFYCASFRLSVSWRHVRLGVSICTAVGRQSSVSHHYLRLLEKRTSVRSVSFYSWRGIKFLSSGEYIVMRSGMKAIVVLDSCGNRWQRTSAGFCWIDRKRLPSTRSTRAKVLVASRGRNRNEIEMK